MFDKRLVHVETISAELTISQPREIALYNKTFAELAAQAVTGSTARGLITTALDHQREASELTADSPVPEP
ncbi:MAG: Scr1 family TA system antitoxin-like transcriptional regulator [Pseudonocardiaceae bacterium]